MIPDPYLQIVTLSDERLSSAPLPSAALALSATPEALKAWQAQADALDLALIRPAKARPLGPSDGFWTDEVSELKRLRQHDRQGQLVALARDRHQAMVLGEAGADLILFGSLCPSPLAGDPALALWWAELFEVPCGLILSQMPSNPGSYQTPGMPEFFAV